MPDVVFSVDQARSMRDQAVPGHNRWHPDIPPAVTVRPGQSIRVECREWTDAQIGNNDSANDVRDVDLNRAHMLSGPIAVEGAEMDAVLRFAERGLGVAVVPAMVVIDRPGLHSTRLISPQLTRTVNLARRIDVEPSAAAAAMQRFVFDTVDRLTAPGTDLARLVTAVPRNR